MGCVTFCFAACATSTAACAWATPRVFCGTRFLSKQGVSIEALYKCIQEDSSTEFHSGNLGGFAQFFWISGVLPGFVTCLLPGSTLIAVINATVEFKNFHVMMCDARAGEFIWGMPPLQDDKTGELFCDR